MSKTLSLKPNEWQALLLSNFQSGFDWVRQYPAQAPSQDDTKALLVHIDRMRDLTVAWHASAAPAVQVEPEQTAAPEAEQPPSQEPPKRKGGWPKGKKRGGLKQVAP